MELLYTFIPPRGNWTHNHCVYSRTVVREDDFTVTLCVPAPLLASKFKFRIQKADTSGEGCKIDSHSEEWFQNIFVSFDIITKYSDWTRMVLKLKGKRQFFISFTLKFVQHTEAGNLVLKHSVLHFPASSRDLALPLHLPRSYKSFIRFICIFYQYILNCLVCSPHRPRL